jgi:nucleolar protein 14
LRSLNPAVNKGILTALLRATLQLFDVASLAVSTDASSLTAAVAQVDVLLPHVYELATVAPDLVVAWARNHVEDAYRETGDAAHDATVGLSARLSVGRIITLRSIARMFPGSDLRHAIMTPLGLLLSHCVSSVPVLTLEDASTACFCASLLVEVLSPAKRFSGELICFLGAMLSTAVPDGKGLVAEVDRRRVRNDLLLGAGRKQAGVLGLGDCFDSSPPGEETGSSSRCHRKMKQQRILNALYSLSRACLYDGGLNSLREAMFPVVKAASALHVSKVCDSSLLDEIETLATKQEEARKPLTLYAEKKGAFVARLLNPKFRSENGVYAGKQRSAGGVAMSDMETQRKLRQQLKKEARSAARELRRDAEAMGALQIRNEDERDAIRTAKGAQARAFMERQQHDSKLQSKKVAVGREGLAAAGRKRKKW